MQRTFDAAAAERRVKFEREEEQHRAKFGELLGPEITRETELSERLTKHKRELSVQLNPVENKDMCVEALTSAIDAIDPELYVTVHILRILSEFVPYRKSYQSSYVFTTGCTA